MAYMIPKSYNLSQVIENEGERAIYLALEKLPDEVVVFHSIGWERKWDRSRIKRGEADFVIYHPNRGILVIEVKSGEFSIRENEWFQINRETNQEIHLFPNPIDQVEKSQYAIRRLFADSNYNIQIESAIWLTSVSHIDGGQLPAYIHPERILLKQDVKRVDKAITSLFNFFGMHNKVRVVEERRYVIDRLAPSFDVLMTGSDLLEYHQEHFFRLTREQNTLLDYLSEQRVAAIQGITGTGKTILAQEQARRLAQKGKVLMLCFNILLRDRLKIELSPYLNIEVHNLQSLMELHLGGNHYYSSQEITDFLDDIAGKNWNYQHIIIDEAQDLLPEHIIQLKILTEMYDGFFYVFFDKHQLVQQRSGLDWLNEMECRLVLNTNCRNTANIAKTSLSPIGVEKVKTLREIDGDRPIMQLLESDSKVIGYLDQKIRELLREGFKRDDITILTFKTFEKSILKQVSKIANTHLVSDEQGNDFIFYTTARKFKGLESEIVFLIDFDDEAFITEEQKRLFYVATSRARSFLYLIFVGDQDNLDRLLERIQNEPNLEEKTNIEMIMNVDLME